MSQKYAAVTAILKGAVASINAILTDQHDDNHRLLVTNELNRLVMRLQTLTGFGDLDGESVSTNLPPAKTIGGEAIKKIRSFSQEDLNPTDPHVQELRESINSALPYFGADASADGILGNIPEVIIRGVAIKAGIPKGDHPKELTTEFVQDIIDTLHNKKAKETGKVTNDVEDDNHEDHDGDDIGDGIRLVSNPSVPGVDDFDNLNSEGGADLSDAYIKAMKQENEGSENNQVTPSEKTQPAPSEKKGPGKPKASDKNENKD